MSARAAGRRRLCAGVRGLEALSYGQEFRQNARIMNENVSLIVMCLFLLGSLAFLAQQLTAYH